MNEIMHLAVGEHVDTVGGNADLSGAVTSILSAIIGSLGLVAVVVMLIGGYNYMTSSGDAAKVEKAKKTILYGAIGLIVCVLSFVIVNFVIVNIIKTDDTTSSSQTTTQSTEKSGDNKTNNK